MKRFLIALLLLLAGISAWARNDWRGRVVDKQGKPVAYANVAILSQADSSVVSGAVTQEDGKYVISSEVSEGILMVAMLGYRTRYLPLADGLTVTLEEDRNLIRSAVATAVMPQTKLTGEGLQTGIRGSVLEHAGTAADVLARTPGIIKGQEGLEVIGKGTPLVYINGRKVTDSGELQRLPSNEIQSVEVISNPGALYDASVRAVVRIRTVKRKGDGLGFTFDASDAQSLQWSKGNDPLTAVNMNFRSGGVDIFAGINYAGNTARQISHAEKTTQLTSKLLENKGDLLAEFNEISLHGNAGVNWQLADNHFFGGKMEWGTSLRRNVLTDVHEDVYLDHSLSEQIRTLSDDCIGEQSPYNLGLNLYYNGLVGEKLGVDLNLDYYGTTKTASSHTEESSEMNPGQRIINSQTKDDGQLYAFKAVLSYPLWTGRLQAGTEETFTRRSDVYSITGIPDIAPSSAQVREDNIAAFASYGFLLPRQLGRISAGLRYEYVYYSYKDALSTENVDPKNYDNLFPTLSFSGSAGPVQLMLNYSAKTRRPDYDLLSSAIRYNSRYIWQSGDASLQPELSHNINFTAVWKYLSVVLNYTRTDETIMTWSTPRNEEGVVLVQPKNIGEPFRNLSAYLNLSPTIGIWKMNYTLGIQPQWLTIHDEKTGRTLDFSGKPIAFAQLQNTLQLKGGWQLELGTMVQSPGHTQNLYLSNLYCNIFAAIQKKLLADGSLVLRLEGQDLAGMAHYDVDSDFGSHTIMQTNRMDTQKIKFSLRYSFNSVQSKYRGTGAGRDTRERM